jgi:hypothetical protein
MIGVAPIEFLRIEFNKFELSSSDCDLARLSLHGEQIKENALLRVFRQGYSATDSRELTRVDLLPETVH